jgi:hypothetical protein
LLIPVFQSILETKWPQQKRPDGTLETSTQEIDIQILVGLVSGVSHRFLLPDSDMPVGGSML